MLWFLAVIMKKFFLFNSFKTEISFLFILIIVKESEEKMFI